MKTKTNCLILQAAYCYRLKQLICLPVIVCLSLFSAAQCTTDSVNWDNLDWIHNKGSYYGGNNPISGLPWVSSAMWQTQKFSIGTNQLTISSVIPSTGAGSLYGDVTTHTGDAGGFKGSDIYLLPTSNGQNMTFTFASEVQNAAFTLNDIDKSAVFTITATNAASVAQTITVTTYAGTILTIGGTATARTITAPNTALANTLNTGAATISVAGPVKTIIVTVTTIGSSADFFLSDIAACVSTTPGFPTNYYSPFMEPFTGQPAYFLANPQNLHVYMVNASTGVAEYLFSDPGTNGNKINSLAFDPENKCLYYVMDNSATQPNNKELKKYNFNTETISSVLSDIGTLGIPTFIQGLEFAGAAFYNGSLYLGVEECDGSSFGNNAESVIWKIDFDGSGTPTGATQVYATNGDNGAGTVMHDWGDFIVKDGIIITHATSGSGTNNQYIHFDMHTGVATTYAGNAESAGQLAQTYNGNVYRVKGGVALYNNDGTIGSSTSITTSSCSSAWSGNAGDGSDPFRPKCDFGDAPASYDPVALSPAVHQQACNNATLRIGSNWDKEWSKTSSSDASADATDEDGIGTPTLITADGTAHSHVQAVSVFNNTGSNATLGGWIDSNLDGVFQSSEGVVVTVSSNGSLQNVNLSWPALTVASGTAGTFLRVRLVSGTGTLTTSNPTGWYSDGEVEDYYVVVTSPPLATENIEFNAVLAPQNIVHLNWSASADNIRWFDVERSADQLRWFKVIERQALSSIQNYDGTDQQPLDGKSYYRLITINENGSKKISNIKEITLAREFIQAKLIPNPVIDRTSLSIKSLTNEIASIRILSMQGEVVLSEKKLIKTGNNKLSLETDCLPSGIYTVEILIQNKPHFLMMLKSQ